MQNWPHQAIWIVAAAALFWLVTAPGSTLSQISPATHNGSAPIGTGGVGGLQMMLAPSAGGAHQVVILDPVQRSLAVYFVDNGNLQLRCVRSLGWDLRMEEFNGLPPLPSELRRVQP